MWILLRISPDTGEPEILKSIIAIDKILFENKEAFSIYI